jgi:hypothetical protein
LNILDAPTFKISDRKLIVARVHGQLLISPDCRYPVAGGWKSLSHDEYGNWEARQHFLKVSLAFSVDKALETLSAEEQPESPVGDLGQAPDQVGETQTTEV